MPVANMWWTHTPKLMNAIADQCGRHPQVAGEPRRENTGMWSHHATAGRKRM